MKEFRAENTDSMILKDVLQLKSTLWHAYISTSLLHEKMSILNEDALAAMPVGLPIDRFYELAESVDTHIDRFSKITGPEVTRLADMPLESVFSDVEPMDIPMAVDSPVDVFSEGALREASMVFF